MPFPSDLSAPQETTLRTSGYWSRVLCCLNPNDVVFMAQASESITDDPFIDFTYDNVTVGDYTDVWEGMLLYLSSTTDINDAYYRGRVRLAPTSGVMYVDKNAEILTDNDYVIIVRDSDLFTRIRDDVLVDGSIAYHETPDVLQGLPSVIVLYDSDNDGDEAYTTVQTPVHVDVNSTSTTTWLWQISGEGTSSVSNPAVKNPTLTFEAGYHYLVRCTHTNNLGDSNYQFMHVYAVTRTFGAPAVLPVVVGGIDGDLQDGWTASLTAYADVVSLIDRTHCVVWHVQHFGDDSDTPIVSNILMNGRIRSDSIQTEGSAEAGRLQQVTFAVEGITSYLRRLRIPNDIVRPTSTPNEWGEIEEPNPYRMVVYAMWVYTTLTNICSFGVESGAFEDFMIGGEPRGIDGGTALDVLTNLLWDTIKAAPNYAPSGELFLARDVSRLTDRSGVPLITTLELQDMRDYTVDRDSSRTTAQVVAFGGAYDSTANSFVLYTAQAPSIVYGDGGEERELTKVILTVDSSATDAAAELGGQASNEFAAENPKPLLRASLFDSWAGVLIPTNYQRWGATIPAASNTLGIAYGASDYWQLQSVNLGINTDGTIDVKGDWPAETEFDDAQTLANLLPLNLSNMNPVLPVLPNEPAFPTDALENYPTDTPELDELQPIDPGSAASAYTPFPPDVAAEVGEAQNKPGCETVRVLFSNENNTTSTKVTVLNDPYLMTVSGSARIAVGGAFDISALLDIPGNDTGIDVQEGDEIVINATGEWCYGIFTPEECNDADGDPTNDGGNQPPPHTGAPLPNDYLGLLVARVGTSGDWTAIGVSGTFNAPTSGRLYLIINDKTGFYGDNLGDISVTVGTPGNATYGDAFYQWNLDEDGNEINVALLGTQGLFLDNSQYLAIPPYDPSHRYTNLPFTGTGNLLLARMEFSSYTHVQDLYLYLDMCRQVSA
jgi:hypothetical protein